MQLPMKVKVELDMTEVEKLVDKLGAAFGREDQKCPHCGELLREEPK